MKLLQVILALLTLANLVLLLVLRPNSNEIIVFKYTVKLLMVLIILGLVVVNMMIGDTYTKTEETLRYLQFMPELLMELTEKVLNIERLQIQNTTPEAPKITDIFINSEKRLAYGIHVISMNPMNSLYFLGKVALVGIPVVYIGPKRYIEKYNENAIREASAAGKATKQTLGPPNNEARI